MIRSNLFDYSDACIHVKGTITVSNTRTAAALKNRNKKVIFENYASFTNCISEINNTQLDDTYDIDVVMPIYNLIEYSDTYSKSSGSLWQYYRDERVSNNNDAIIDSPADNINSIPFKFKQKITGQTGNNWTKDIKIIVPLKYLSNFWKTLEMLLINYKISLTLTWSKNCF